MIRKDHKSFVGLMGRLLPIDLHTKADEAKPIIRTFEQVDANLAARGDDARRLIEMGERMAEREAERQRLRNGSDSLN